MKSIRTILKGLTRNSEALERIENLQDLRAAEAALADSENRQRVPWEEVEKALKL